MSSSEMNVPDCVVPAWNALGRIPVLEKNRLWQHYPYPKARPTLVLRDTTEDLLEQHDLPLGEFRYAARKAGHTHGEASLLGELRLLLIGVPRGSEEWRRRLTLPTEEEWAEQERCRQVVYEREVEKAIQEAKEAAGSFASLPVEEMARYYAEKPDGRIWAAITSLVPLETLVKAENDGDDRVCKRLEKEEELANMCRDYGF